MHSSIVKSLSAAAVAACVMSASAAAQGKSHDAHGHGKGDERRGDEQRTVIVDPRRDDDPRRVVVESNGEYRKVPPGLAKKGGMPPGQAKKYYRASQGIPVMREVFMRHGYTVVRTQPYGSSQYVYYRQQNGPIQRAVIVPGTGQLGFQNVPASLVQEILARLY